MAANPQLPIHNADIRRSFVVTRDGRLPELLSVLQRIGKQSALRICGNATRSDRLDSKDFVVGDHDGVGSRAWSQRIMADCVDDLFLVGPDCPARFRMDAKQSVFRLKHGVIAFDRERTGRSSPYARLPPRYRDPVQQCS